MPRAAPRGLAEPSDCPASVAAATMKAEPLRAPTESEEAYRLRLKHYPSASDCLYAIELPPGEYAKLGVKAGDTIALDYAKFKSYLR